MSEMDKTCLDYLMTCRINGREEDIVSQYYLENGTSKEQVEKAIKAMKTLETVGEMKFGGSDCE